MWGKVVLILLGFAHLIFSDSCPDDDDALKLWSDSTTWTGNGVPVPSTSTDIKILSGMHVKLDTNTDVRSITIEKDGSLIWDSTKDTVVKTHYILVKGRLEIGGENCKFNSKTEIILKGKRDEIADIPDCGQKFICVVAGGTLELHGKDKLSWTKLDTTIDKLDYGKGILYSYHKSDEARIDWKEGLRVFDYSLSDTIAQPRQKAFYLSGTNGWETDKGFRDIGPFIQGIPNGNIVGVALLRKLKGSRDLASVYKLLEDELGARRIREVDHDDTYALIGVKGDPSKTIEDLDRSGRPLRRAKVSMEFRNINRQIDVISQLNENDWFGNKVNSGLYEWTHANRKVKIAENAFGWEQGDKVLFTSTDFDMEQAETGFVQTCDDCQDKEIRVSLVPEYVHWSQLDYNTDMRGEIALLSRNIKIQGEIQNGCPTSNKNCHKFKFDTFGGHIKFLRNFENVHVEGVELENMGQQTSLGHYPLHFHMCHDADNYPEPPYLKKNSIYRSFARCMTIHGTHGTKIEDNVCFDTLGHSIFLEDGGEKRTVIDGNLVAVTRKGSLVPGDETPASYWITNPKTKLCNNVAAGSEQMGFWIIFPDEPTGESRNQNFMKKDEAKHTKFTEMKNNLAHSNFMSGLFFDGILHDNLQVEMFGKNAYFPRTIPTDPKNAAAKDDPVFIENLTCWKNRVFNTWTSGGYMVMKHYSSADSSRGIEMVRQNNQEQFIEHSVIMGETDNIGEPTLHWNHGLSKHLAYPRSLALPWDPKTPIQGLTIYNGPVYADKVWFGFFKPTENYTSGAIGFNRQMKVGSSPVSALSDVQFGFEDPSEGNRVYDGDKTVHGFSDLDGDKGATFRDEGGSVTLLGDSQIVKPGPFYTTSACKMRDNWDMAICPYKYGKLDIDIDWTSPEKGKTSAIMVRDDVPDNPEILHDKNTADFMTILGGTHSYTLHWTNGVPSKFWVWGNGIEKDEFVRLGICLPVNAKFNLFTWSPKWRPSTSTWTQVSSIEALDNDKVGDRYFFDSSTGLLFVKFISYKSRGEGTTKDCEGHCPVVQITVTSGNRRNGDCRQKAYENPGTYRKPSSGVVQSDNHAVLPMTSTRPPADWGAGAQVPFRKIVAINGGFTSWSDYSACSVQCGGGTKTRTRACTNPAPANGGLECSGTSSETVTCNTQACVFAQDGGFSHWGAWSPCQLAESCEGVQTRERSCDNPAPTNDGKYCTGAVKEVQSCNKCLPPAA